MGTSINVGKRGLLAIFTCILASASLSVSCSKDDTEKTLSEETASLTVTLNGQAPRTKAVVPPEDADELEKAENTVKNATVFVFNANGTLDKRQTLAAPSLSATISGLLAGEKRVVVVANVPSGVAFPDGINYSWFADAQNAMDLETQSPQTNGLFMSGEGTVTLSANSTAATTVSVSRVAAKVKLGTITISPEAGHDPDKFVLSRAVVMKARGSATMGLPSVNTPELFYGGMAGDKSAEKSYLSETISADDHSNRYFYVFPNDNTGGNATLITLVGTYDLLSVPHQRQAGGRRCYQRRDLHSAQSRLYGQCDAQTARRRQR